MPEVPPKPTPGAALAVADEAQAFATEARSPAADGTEGRLWTVASHEALFGEAPASRCDACGEAITEVDGAEDEAQSHAGYGFPGRGVYLSTRGGEPHLESVPLCASCASAIGMTALGRWEIEEEEG